MKFYIADAFAENIFAGNPAGVVITGGDFLDDNTCISTAAELRYSETAFIKRNGPCDFTIRYFTPVSEVDLCGHATIASFYVLKHSGIINDGNFTARTKAGNLNINVKNNTVMMDMASPVHIATISEESEIKRLYEILGAENIPKSGMLPMIISTGLPDIIMPVSGRAELNSLAPDMNSLSALSEEYNVVGVHPFAPDASNEVTAHARDFAPMYGINEEAATGTASGALAYYLYLNNLITKDTDLCFIQGEAMNRASKIAARIRNDGSIQVGGSAAVLAEGEIHI
ncbi:MAG: PhzF family phenazine biosynthesis protein [Clostridiales bacterium]|nr:PhzF family phenazine biosynthesis protein [Clostridiales bacterium]